MKIPDQTSGDSFIFMIFFTKFPLTPKKPKDHTSVQLTKLLFFFFPPLELFQVTSGELLTDSGHLLNFQEVTKNVTLTQPLIKYQDLG